MQITTKNLESSCKQLVWHSTMPANIALIKYMGKEPNQKNQGCNTSLSYTLPHLNSTTTLKLTDAKQDVWQADPKNPVYLSAPQIKRFLDHLAFLKDLFGVKANFTVTASNSFPHACGLASSASSFASLTEASAQALSALTQSSLPDLATRAQWSRQGSGSSCRSFYAPFALWEQEQCTTCPLPYPSLIHAIILIDNQPKAVSSSQAHQRALTSSLFATRPKRANERCHALIQALQQKDWQQAYQITWQEFQDMHALFHTAAQPFSYMHPNSIQALNGLAQWWEDHQDGPLVTMDAGCNIHLLFRPDQSQQLAKIKATLAPLTFIQTDQDDF
jgi:diphosphomevalonate decarboxylase